MSEEESRSLFSYVFGGLITARIFVESQYVLVPITFIFIDPVFSSPLRSVLQWSVYAILFYLAAKHWLYDRLLEGIFPRQAPEFPALFTLAAVSVGFASENMSVNEVFTVLLPLVVVFSSLFVVYIAYTTDNSLFGSNGVFPTISRKFTYEIYKNQYEGDSNEQQNQTEKDNLYHRTKIVLFVGLVLGMPAFLSGMLVPALQLAFPFPELILLFWVFQNPAKRKGPDEISPPEDNVPDIFGQSLKGITDLMDVLKGTMLTSVILGGMVVSLTSFWHARSLVDFFFESPFQEFVATSFVDRLLFVWGIAGMISLLTLAGGYGLWIWICELRRAKIFNSYWKYERYSSEIEDLISIDTLLKSVSTRTAADDDLHTDRPPFYVLVPYLLVSIVGVFVDVVTDITPADTTVNQDVLLIIRVIWMIFGVIWPLLCLGVLGLIWSGFRSSHSTNNSLAAAVFLIISIPLFLFLTNIYIVAFFIGYILFRWKVGVNRLPTSIRFEDIMIVIGVLILMDAYASIINMPISGRVLPGISLFLLWLVFQPDIERLASNKLTTRKELRLRLSIAAAILLFVIVLSIPSILQYLLVLQAIVTLIPILSKNGTIN